jgi:hypothetical protein
MKIQNLVPKISKLGLWIGAVVLVLFLASCGNGQDDGTIVASGFIEGEEVIVASEVAYCRDVGGSRGCGDGDHDLGAS